VFQFVSRVDALLAVLDKLGEEKSERAQPDLVLSPQWQRPIEGRLAPSIAPGHAQTNFLFTGQGKRDGDVEAVEGRGRGAEPRGFLIRKVCRYLWSSNQIPLPGVSLRSCVRACV
jgi:hypothetical protein